MTTTGVSFLKTGALVGLVVILMVPNGCAESGEEQDPALGLLEPTMEPEACCTGCCAPPGCTEQTYCAAYGSDDVLIDDYLFVHGYNAKGGSAPNWDGGAFEKWMNYSGMVALTQPPYNKIVHAGNYGYTSQSFANGGYGTGTLSNWVNSITADIQAKWVNTGRPDRSVRVVTHSTGGPVIECLLEAGARQVGQSACSGYITVTQDHINAAKKIKAVHTVQAAHGACGDSNCLWSDTIGFLDDISDNDLNVRMDLAVAGPGGSLPRVPITHVRAGGGGSCFLGICDECEGFGLADGYLGDVLSLVSMGLWGMSTGDLCSGYTHDGVTELGQQDSGRFQYGYGDSGAPAEIKRDTNSSYCHDKGTGDDYPGYRHAASRVRDVVGKTPTCLSWESYYICTNEGGGDDLP